MIDTNFINTRDIKTTVINKLKTNKCVLFGAVQSLEYVEETLYPPGTENRGFEILCGGNMRHVAFCEKTRAFKKMFSENKDNPIVCLIAFHGDDGGVLFNISEHNPNNQIEKTYDMVGSKVADWLINGKLPYTLK